MGKYMRKAKLTSSGVTMTDVSLSTLGVRTRAKTLALQRLQGSTAAAEATESKPDYCYLQLRSRRLEKPLLLAEPKPQAQRAKQCSKENGQEVQFLCEKETGLIALISDPMTRPIGVEERVEVENRVVGGAEFGIILGHEGVGSIGENNLDAEQRERTTRESTPCSFTRDVDIILTPGSSTRLPSSDAANQGPQNGILRNIPSTREMDEFFARAEQQQQLFFVEKYNFDIMNDIPLPGRYEWVKVNH